MPGSTRRTSASSSEACSLDETRDGLIAIAERMQAREGIDGLILGGTELPLILRDSAYAGVPVLDSTGIDVEAALDWLLGE